MAIQRAHLKPTLQRLRTSFKNPFLDLVWTAADYAASGIAAPTPRELEKLRKESDPLADECIRALNVRPGSDSLKALDEYVSRPVEEQPSAAPREFMEQVTTIPLWVDPELVKQGQNVFWKYVLLICIILTDYSLPIGFAAARMTDILSCTNYFSSVKGTFQRVFETTKFLSDIMKGPEALTPLTGCGWKSTIRVRLLHTQVRLRILAQAEKRPDIYNVEELGVPINQEDMLCTLCEFSIAIISVLKKMDVHMSTPDIKAYLHFWRFMGYLMGIDDKYCRKLTTEAGATVVADSIHNHLVDPDAASVLTTHNLFEAMAFSPPLFWPAGVHVAVTRRLVGDRVCNGLQLPPSKWYWQILASCVLASYRWIFCSTIFLQQRIDLTMKYVPPFLEYYVHRIWAKDALHKPVACDFALKFIPHIGSELDDGTR
ncbi:hypothetical protein R1sor_007933 [Riccia sorocarpa]|uniref:ER-bound oxygenase mpaB/mpaB'/Rubber oxygenase catalytic domain-containing protein n=1 Tax=Riccia sorocarpa TaxID=122646 RepID=A0ABD3HUS7_9MARC